MDEIAEIWAPDVGVTAMTDTDLISKRNYNTNVSDPDYELHQLVDSLVDSERYPDRSYTCDVALRIEVAAILDTGTVSVGRADFDVKYIIPPSNWVSDQTFESVDVINMCDVDTDERGLNFSTPTVVYEMGNRLVNETGHDTLSELCHAGVCRLAGQQ